MAKFWPGPLTIVLHKSKQIDGIITSGLNTVGIRMPNHSLALELLKTCELPLAAPSCNLFTKLSPTHPDHILGQFQTGIAGILDGGPCNIGVESTVIKLSEKEIQILRPGGISQKELSAIAPTTFANSIQKEDALKLKPGQGPGLMEKHYAPNTPIYLLPKESHFMKEFSAEQRVILKMEPNSHYRDVEAEQIILSASGQLHEAASKLFSTLHELDKRNLQAIFAELPSETGIGQAIRDRLTRAANARD